MKRKTWVTFNHPLTFGPRPSRLKRWIVPAMALPLVIGAGYTVSKQLSPTASKPVPTASTSVTKAAGRSSKPASREEGRARLRR
ncbi:MAG: hypothetical protein ACJ8J7_07425 [Sulfurifustaceae bacterium]